MSAPAAEPVLIVAHDEAPTADLVAAAVYTVEACGLTPLVVPLAPSEIRRLVERARTTLLAIVVLDGQAARAALALGILLGAFGGSGRRPPDVSVLALDTPDPTLSRLGGRAQTLQVAPAPAEPGDVVRHCRAWLRHVFDFRGGGAVSFPSSRRLVDAYRQGVPSVTFRDSG